MIPTLSASTSTSTRYKHLIYKQRILTNVGCSQGCSTVVQQGHVWTRKNWKEVGSLINPAKPIDRAIKEPSISSGLGEAEFVSGVFMFVAIQQLIEGVINKLTIVMEPEEQSTLGRSTPTCSKEPLSKNNREVSNIVFHIDYPQLGGSR